MFSAVVAQLPLGDRLCHKQSVQTGTCALKRPERTRTGSPIRRANGKVRAMSADDIRHGSTPRSGRRVWGRCYEIHVCGVLLVDCRSYLSKALSFVQHFDHVTRDSEAYASSWRHRVENDTPVGIDGLHVAVTIVVVPGVLPAAAEARHEPHDLAVGYLEFIQGLDICATVGHKRRPIHFGEIAVWLVGSRESAETRREVHARSRSIPRHLCGRGRASTAHGGDGCRTESPHDKLPATQHLVIVPGG